MEILLWFVKQRLVLFFFFVDFKVLTFGDRLLLLVAVSLAVWRHGSASAIWGFFHRIPDAIVLTTERTDMHGARVWA